uniref:Uncharacterized protein n=1 Tax=Anguilla anguilla TaxID=7936 RepID=A0A0E9Q8P0_ANGAN
MVNCKITNGCKLLGLVHYELPFVSHNLKSTFPRHAGGALLKRHTVLTSQNSCSSVTSEGNMSKFTFHLNHI